jgi:hypothetical protein
MSYYTLFTFEAKQRVNNKIKDVTGEIIPEFRAANEQAKYALDEDGYPANQAKWYDWKESLIEISKLFPEILMSLSGEGEESNDLWAAYALNGYVEISQAVLTYPDNSLLKNFL